MGTNYYWHEGICSECGATKGETIHVGKSSAGWCFSLHVGNDFLVSGLGDWKIRFDLPGSVIRDEYNRTISPSEMMSVITERTWFHRERTNSFYSENDAEPGPNHLLRHRVDGKHCVGHGEGTWDLIAEEFS